MKRPISLKAVKISMSLLILAQMFLCAFNDEALALNVTLNKEGLMSLDFYSSSILTPQVVAKRDAGTGVEFDIQFPGSSGLDSQMFYASSIYGNTGSLVENDFSSFSCYQLTFTFVSIFGIAPAQAQGLELWVAPFVNDGAGLKYFTPEMIGLAPGQEQTKTASMDISLLNAGYSLPGDKILELGFEVHMDYPYAWSPTGSLVTLFISPAAGATAIPEPATLFLLGLGAVMLRRKR